MRCEHSFLFQKIKYFCFFFYRVTNNRQVILEIINACFVAFKNINLARILNWKAYRVINIGIAYFVCLCMENPRFRFSSCDIVKGRERAVEGKSSAVQRGGSTLQTIYKSHETLVCSDNLSRFWEKSLTLYSRCQVRG